MALAHRSRTLLLWPGLPLIYLLLPGHPLGWLSGLPWSLESLSVAVGLLVLAVLAGSGASIGRAAALVLLALCVARVLLFLTAPGYGLEALYRTAPNGPPERSIFFKDASFTRVDQRLDFYGEEFPVYFFNDQRRFNFYSPSQPRRDLLPFEATWRGWLGPVEPGETLQLAIWATGSAQVSIDDRVVLDVQRAAAPQLKIAELPPDNQSRPLQVRYSRPEGSVPLLRLGWITPSGFQPLARTALATVPVSNSRLAVDTFASGLARALDVAMLLVAIVAPLWPLRRRWSPKSIQTALGSGVLLDRAVVATVLLFGLLEGLRTWGWLAGQATILSGGNDWLAYENYARDIILNGWLGNEQAPLGRGEPFFYQPLYSYVLAGMHLLIGESVGSVLVLQRLALAASGALVYLLARQLGGRAAGLVALLVFWVIRFTVGNPVAGLLLSENLAVPLVLALCILMGRYLRTFELRDLVLGGVALGCAALARSTPLLSLPLIGLTVLVANRRRGFTWRAALRPAVLFGVVTMLCVLPATMRNLVVSGQPILITTTTGNNLWDAHRPPARINLRGIDQNALYDALKFDRPAREVAEFVRQDPVAYAGTLVVQAAYAVGYTGLSIGDGSVRWEVVGLVVLYLLSIVLLPRLRVISAWPIHAFVATHMVAMTVFQAHQYGFRLVLPMYGVMAAPAGALLAEGLARCTRVRLSVRGAVLAATAAATVALSAAAITTPPSEVEERVFGLGGDAGAAARAVRDRIETLVRGDARGTRPFDTVYFGGRDGRSAGVAHLPGLEYWPMKWLDVSTAAVLPSPGHAALALWPLATDGSTPQPLYLRCGLSAVAQATPGSGPTLAMLSLEDRLVLPGCRAAGAPLATFGGLARVVAFEAGAARAGGAPGTAQVEWEVVDRPSYRAWPALAGDSDPVRATAAYPSGSWAPGERVIARLPIAADLTPGQLALVFWRSEPDRLLEITDPARLFGQTALPLPR